ncbi:glutathione S-transferase family protein [Prosthecomicrobium hirschii]|uniref:glutathione S-transferase family protein n=1 Tax=Prosthecodimorpha hirschii TaxID=665126 RepID=UPI00221F1C9F|nr:glutathione S-transferase family protein [Prosthecomicrobium hirschii]MCW1839376.1 glutathione S-transferase family protein [Prosthecomicrobium hirschii]
MVTLYWAPQTRSLSILWLLEELGIPYRRELIDIRAGRQSDPEFRAINPMMKVPALTDGPVKVAETGAIVAYLADRYTAAGLAPAVDDPARGDYLRWLFFAGSSIEAAYVQIFTKLEMNPTSAGWGSAERVFDVIEAGIAGSGGPWLLGETFSAADISVGSGLRFGLLFKIVEPRPAFTAYVERCTARPAFARAQAIEAEALAARGG